MAAVDPLRRCTWLVLPVLLCGCHDWVTHAEPDGDVPADVGGDGESAVDVPDVPDESPDADLGADDGWDDAGPGEDGESDETASDLDVPWDGDVPADTDDGAGPLCGNGVLEPGEDCEVGTEIACTTVCGSTGTTGCPDNCLAPPPAACPVPAEICNGRDDDCNGRADDGRRVCPDCDVVARGSSVYHFCEAQTWESGRTACRTRGMYLTTIDDEVENGWLAAEMAARASLETWWIGFSDTVVEGVWVWDGPPPLDPSFSAWCAGEPNDYGTGEDCAEHLFADGCWNDNDCSGARRYVCEYP